MKVIVISNSNLSMRQMDYFCLADLYKSIDIEYWDCTKILRPASDTHSDAEFQGLRKITDIRDLKEHLAQLPYDVIVVFNGHFNDYNYKFHKTLSSYCKNICVIDFFANASRFFSFSETKENIQNADITKHHTIKTFIYKSDICRLAIKCIFHPSKTIDFFREYYTQKSISLYQVYHISCAKGATMYINNPDVDKYMRNRAAHKDIKQTHIVYIDQFFPYHPEIKAYNPGVDVEGLANTHFKKINELFAKIEELYKVPVIIAAHPVSVYNPNPFEGRKICYFQTEQLVAGCKAVIMHFSNAIAYPMLYNKPTILVEDAEMKESGDWFYVPIINLQKKYGLQLWNIDNRIDRYIIPPIPKDVRVEYVTEHFGTIDETNYTYNSELFKRHFESIHNEMVNSYVAER